MGINLIMTEGGKDLPMNEWDFCRHSGDSDIAGALGGEIVAEQRQTSEIDWEYRPDPESLLKFCERFDFNEERWAWMVDAFRKRPDLWLRVSY